MTLHNIVTLLTLILLAAGLIRFAAHLIGG